MNHTFTDEVRDQSLAIARKTGEEVRKHPIAAAAIAVAAFGLIGYVVSQTMKPARNGRSAH